MGFLHWICFQSVKEAVPSEKTGKTGIIFPIFGIMAEVVPPV
jgi:hypothetical protein